ncbi:hypothetical protein CASFOL_030695 [Castilleja foliolosa]|uniref:RRM domain-containing protein n=1 Tax=Castilleja foliolosa TaxID=1961234 RepID=A0ABD3C7Z7_9LAMI
MEEKLRIYIGGLGSNVQEDDLRKTFTSPQLGTVQSVEIIRSKGRSFGYLEYVPSSEKGLAKLFSTYNGCMWKGGRLKLEKAKENYLSRLKHEWTEDAELEIKSSIQNVDVDEFSPHLLQKPKKDLDINKLQLNLFFPKLRKIKSIPFKGTGKHKYSFQRIEVPPLPVHFCDCEEHSGPPETAKRDITVHHEMDAYGVNEDELNMMQSILNKLLEKDDSTKTVNNKTEYTEEINKDTTLYADNLQVDEDKEEEQVSDDPQVDEDEEEQVSDEDNLVINIVGQTSKKTTAAANQVSWVREQESFSKSIPKISGSNKEKRKHLVHENESNDIIIPSKKKPRKGVPRDSLVVDPVTVNTQPTDTKLSSRKSAWKDLVVKKENTAFHISDILPNPTPDVEANENDGREEQPIQDLEPSINSDAQLTNPSVPDVKIARGSAWLQKSSWLQLVADANRSTFNLSQILPGSTFEKDEPQQLGENQFSNSENETVGVYSTKENDHVNLDSAQPDSDSKRPVEEEGEAVAQICGSSNMLPSNRVVPEIVISETCPFMKSAASMKEWMKSKAALSGSHKKTGKGKETIQ